MPTVILAGHSEFGSFYDEAIARLPGVSFVRHAGSAESCDDEALVAADIVVTPGKYSFTRVAMARTPRLRAVISPISGTENVDKAAATALGILVANGRMPENYESMAESTIMLILAALYDLHGVQRSLHEGTEPAAGRMLRGRTVGLIGYGAIGHAVASRLAGWSVRILVATPRPPGDLPNHVRPATLAQVLRECDVVSLHYALNDETRGMLTPDLLARMKPDVVFINTARGGLYDEDALAALAHARPAMRLVLDTFAVEPLPVDSPLRAVSNAILTPHAIGHTREVLDAIPVVLA